MNVWANAVITQKGLALQSKLTKGHTLKITRAVTGIGYVAPPLLQTQIAVSGIKQTLVFQTESYPEEGKCSLPVTLKNDGLASGYVARQVGIYAMDPDVGEILYFIAQAAAENKGTEVPSETEMPGYCAEWTFYFQYGQADSVSVTVDPANTVNAEQVEVMLQERAAAAVGVAEGSAIHVTDAYGLGVLHLTVGGNTELSGNPSPDAPATLSNTKTSRIIRTGKNLFNTGSVEDYAVVSPTVELAIGDNTLTGKVISSAAAWVCNKTPIPATGGEYYFSGTVDSGHTRFLIRLFNEAGENISENHQVSGWTYNSSYAGLFTNGNNRFTLPDECSYFCAGVIFIGLWDGTSGYTQTYKNVQIESSHDATTYEVCNYQEVQVVKELGSCGDERDSIEFDGKKWWMIQRTMEIELDGVTEGKKAQHVIYLENRNLYYASITVEHPSMGKYGGTAQTGNKCTHFYAHTFSAAAGHCYFAGANNDGWLLYHTDQTLTTVDLWNAWLAEQAAAGTPVKIRYLLAEPIITELDIEEVLEMVEGETNLWTEFTGNAPHIALRYANSLTDDTMRYLFEKLASMSKQANEFAESVGKPGGAAGLNENGAVPISQGGTGAITKSGAISNLGAATTKTYQATVSASWTADGDFFYQDISVSGILDTDSPVVDIKPGSDNAANLLYSESICEVFRITTSANSIRVWAKEAISTAFPIQIKVVR